VVTFLPSTLYLQRKSPSALTEQGAEKAPEVVWMHRREKSLALEE
jgi:Mn-dependent DtxR family transcriptional regulator